jgi:hypothetical protein
LYNDRNKLRTAGFEIGKLNSKTSLHSLTKSLLKQIHHEHDLIKHALEKEPIERSEADIDFVSKWLFDHESPKVQDLFRSLPNATLRQTCREMRYRMMPEDSVVIAEGEHGDLAFIIISGTASVFTRTAGSSSIFDEVTVVDDGKAGKDGKMKFFDPKHDAETVKKVERKGMRERAWGWSGHSQGSAF